MTWNDAFLELFDRCVAAYRSGNLPFENCYTAADVTLLGALGYRSREFSDYVEDFCDDGEPTATTALLIAAVRRDYFLTVQDGTVCAEVVNPDDLPTFGDELDGMTYLPRILAKARAKLCGSLGPDLMFGCGGDRQFLQNQGEIHPADFLRWVWACDKDDGKLARWVSKQGA